MATVTSLAIISSSSSQPTLFHPKLFLRSSSIAHDLSLLGSSVLLSHATQVVAPRATQSNSIRCCVAPIVPKRRCRIIMDKPDKWCSTDPKIYDQYVQLLVKVARIPKEKVKKIILNPSYKEPFGFECVIDMETLKKLEDLSCVREVHLI